MCLLRKEYIVITWLTYNSWGGLFRINTDLLTKKVHLIREQKFITWKSSQHYWESQYIQGVPESPPVTLKWNSAIQNSQTIKLVSEVFISTKTNWGRVVPNQFPFNICMICTYLHTLNLCHSVISQVFQVGFWKAKLVNLLIILRRRPQNEIYLKQAGTELCQAQTSKLATH